MNNNDQQQNLETSRFHEMLGKFKSGKEIISGNEISDLSKLTVPAKSVLIIELH